MSHEHAPTQQQTGAPERPSRVGQVIVAGVIVLATAGAFGIAALTFDKSLSPLQRQARAEIRGLEGYFKSFHRITGRFPSQAENFYPLLQVGLLKEVPNDPWGRPYQYRMSDEGKGYIMSYGSDGLPGGSGDAADLISGGVLNNAIVGTPEQQEAAKGEHP
ncbi:type II secretion system protein GspG [Vitiosangium sp. GDMCC 1.1324]|uniref:type II secretion system protein GspG n=1 Tax=Vitiosangium sp. (strain GDMCC 1.1324) TaxID=2138576 RepID=UPI000D3D54B5|nr:type II secretion system protein GspG [Vitiosangium sp. GDMCC 1.1324]PTL80434.1 general secretion pathway protein GspG [Vitiosangium sp. GDMCC 1.1324]